MEFVSTLVDFVLPITIVFIMLAIGLAAQPRKIATALSKKTRVITLKAVIANMLVIPMTGFLLLVYSPLPQNVLLVIFLLSLVPGAPILPALVHHNKGDIDWTLAMLFILTATSILAVPVALELARSHLTFLENQETALRKLILLNYILPVFVPLVVGLAVKSFYPLPSEKLISPISNISKKLSVVLLVVVFAKNWDGLVSLELSMFIIITTLLTLWAVVGTLMVIPARKEVYISSAITAALRNFAVVLLLLNILTDDLAAPMYMLASSGIAVIVCASLPYFKRT